MFPDIHIHTILPTEFIREDDNGDDVNLQKSYNSFFFVANLHDLKQTAKHFLFFIMFCHQICLYSQEIIINGL